jgi:formylglycine-generating enzyme required for sulfatase activity
MSDFPYPGLRSFQRDEIDIFFGREEQIDQLITCLDQTHFLAVVGLSGCGKSSLVRTGLLADLEAGFLADAGVRWQVVDMRPSHRPFANLAEALLDTTFGQTYMPDVTHAEAAAFLQAELQRISLLGLPALLQETSLPADTNFLLFVDQFEEIFRYYQDIDKEEAEKFVTLLLASCQSSSRALQNNEKHRVYVIITMRSDFFGNCALFPGLPEAINQSQFLTPRLSREQLRDAIVSPARVFDGDIEEPLVNKLLNDAGTDFDQLPLLQHALMRMWGVATHHLPEGEKCLLTLAHYEQIGGLKMALSNHADKVYNALNPAQQEIAEILFRNLSERDSSRRDTRRPIQLAEVARLAQVDWEAVVPIVEDFRRAGRSFLMPPVGYALVPNSVLDISHESLIRQWQRMQAWLNQEADWAKRYQRLEETAQRWKQGRAALLRSPELEHVTAWRTQAQPTIQWAERYGQDFDLAMAFLEESKAEQHKEAKAIQKRRQVTIALLVGGLAIAIMLTAFALFQMSETEKQRQALYKRTDFTHETYTKELVQQEKDWEIFHDPFLQDSDKKGPKMIWIPAGSFVMGDIQGEGDNDEKPKHKVSIKRFAMSRYEVTVGEFRQFVEAIKYQTEAEKGYGCQVVSKRGLLENKKEANWLNPDFPIKDDQPVVCVSWHDAMAYIEWLSTETGQTYRLPSEAQWEYAARAEKETVFWWRNNIGKNWANCDGCSSNGDKKIAPVGSFKANPFGLYDTVGNVWEWVADPWHSSYQEAPSDGRVWEEKGNHCARVIRGGAWNEKPRNIRAAYRHGKGFLEGSFDSRRFNLGFRIIKLEKPDYSQKSVTKLTPAERKRLCSLAEFKFTKDTAKVKAFEVAQRYIDKVGVFRDSLKDGSEGPEMILIPAGEFQMGDIQGGGDDNEKPVHRVSVSAFAMGRYEVTFEEYDRFADATGREKPEDEGWGRGNRPVINVSWNDATAYMEWLSEQTGKAYRLPTEAEWEYVARAGTETKYWWGNQIGKNWANCYNCGSQWDEQQTAPVGSFMPNPFGLYDTSGNVWEWTCSEYERRYSGKEQHCLDDKNEGLFVLRGGSWEDIAWWSRSSIRSRDSRTVRDGFYGFRPARLL